VEAAPAEVVIIKNVDLIPETTTGGEEDDEDELDIELLFNSEFEPNTAHVMMFDVKHHDKGAPFILKIR